MLIRFTGIFVAAALTAGVANAKDITLRWGHYLGDSSFLQAEKDFATNVTERTEGRVKIEITYAGGLGAGNEVLTLAGRGAIDMASVVPGYYSDQLLYWRAYQIPFVFESPRQAMEISAAAYQDLPYFEDELTKFGVKFLFHQLVEQELDAKLCQLVLKIGQILIGGCRDFHRLTGALEDERNLIGAPVQKLVGIVTRHDRRHVDGAAASKGQHLIAGTKTTCVGDFNLYATFGSFSNVCGKILLRLEKG